MATQQTIDAVLEFLTDEQIDPEWLRDHTNIRLEKVGRKLIIAVDNIDCQEYGWIEETLK